MVQADDLGALPPELMLDDPPVTDELLTEPLAVKDGELYGLDGEPVRLGSWEQVEWAMRRLRRAQARLDATAERYGEMVGRIDAWYESETTGDKLVVDRLSGLLQRFGIAQRLADPKGPATFRFPSGTIRTKERKEPRVDVSDEAAVVAWVLTNLDADARAEVLHQALSVRVTDLRNHVRIKEAEDGTAYVVDADDSLVPGCIVNPPEVTATFVLDTQEGM